MPRIFLFILYDQGILRALFVVRFSHVVVVCECEISGDGRTTRDLERLRDNLIMNMTQN